MSGVEIPVSLYHDETEQLCGVLGQGYVASILSQGSMQESVMVLTDKRLYQKGTVFERCQNNCFLRTQGKKAVDVRDITGTSFTRMANTRALTMGILFLVVAFCVMGYSFTSSVQAIQYLVWMLLGFGIFGLMGYFTSRRNLFVVEYAGGAIATNCDWYSMSEIEDFQKKISRIKDSRR
jgi:hypothetical protein